MEYFPNIKPKRKGKSSLTYLDDCDIILDSEGSEIREETHRSLRATLNGHRRPLSAESSNCSSLGLRRSEVRQLESTFMKSYSNLTLNKINHLSNLGLRLSFVRMLQFEKVILLESSTSKVLILKTFQFCTTILE